MSAPLSSAAPAAPPSNRARTLTGLSFGLAAVLALVAWRRDELARSAMALVLAGAAAACAGLALRGRRRAVLGPLLALAVVNLLVLVPELGLRAAGFTNEPVIEFGYPRPSQFMRLRRDERLFWTMDPEQEDINSLGFPGPEVAPTKPPGVRRILFLGDSCTFQGKHEGTGLWSGYPYETVELLNERAGADGPTYETVSTGVPGYTSHQGLLVSELYGEAFDPDAVVVYFGWNDHWSAYGATDREKKVTPARWDRLYRRVRLLQLLAWLRSRLPGGGDEPLPVERVPLEDYRENLRAICDLFQARGVPVVLITAPTSYRKLGVPRYLGEMRFVPDQGSAADLHGRYTDVVREVAAERGATLLDLEQELDQLPAERMREVFLTDGIHYTGEGIDQVSERLAPVLADVLSRPPPRGH